MKTVSVVIPVYNQSHLTYRCLESLLKNSRFLKEVFLVNNASQDDTAEIVEKFVPAFQSRGIVFEITTNHFNLGFGKACNQGLRKMTGEYLVVLNNDTWLMPEWDLVLIQKCTDFQLDCIGPYFYEKPLIDEQNLLEVAEVFVAKNKFKMRTHFVPILMMFTRKAYEVLKFTQGDSAGGLFDERFFVTYEDTDLKHRMGLLGLKHGQTGACFIWHYSMGTRNVKGALPPHYEQDGLKKFIDKWGFDPRLKDHTLRAKVTRRWWKIKEKYGYF